MGVEMVKVGIVGLGRWARVLARAAAKSDRLKIVAATSRSVDKRQAFAREFAIPAVASLEAMLADPAIAGVILTVPNEQHLPLAAQVAAAGKHVYTEKPIASTLEDGLVMADLPGKHGITVTVGHSARLMAGIRQIRAAIDRGELGRVAFMEANFSTSARSSSPRRRGAGTKTVRPAGRCRSSPSSISTCCATSAATSSRQARSPQNYRRSAPRWTISR